MKCLLCFLSHITILKYTNCYYYFKLHFLYDAIRIKAETAIVHDTLSPKNSMK